MEKTSKEFLNDLNEKAKEFDRKMAEAKRIVDEAMKTLQALGVKN